MRIGIDARLWGETGVGRYIRNLVGQLADIDKVNEYVLFVADRQNFQFPISNFQSNKWKIVEANVRWHSIEEQLRLPAILQKEKLDLVHFPYFSVPIFYKGKFIVTIHDLIIHHFDTGRATTLPLPLYKAKRLGYKLIIRQVAKKAAKIIAVSNATKDEVVKHLKVDPDKVVVAYEGVDQQIAKGKGRREKNSKFPALSPKQYFLYIGNAYPHKNLLRLLEAFSRMRMHPNQITPNKSEYSDTFGQKIRMNSDVKLVLVGKEDYFYRKLKNRVKDMGLTDHVVFSGEISDEELETLFQNAKALIVPSLMEGFGLPALEAMANKCLILASDIPVLREICGECAIYFNPFDVNDVAEKMRNVYINDVHHYSKKKHLGLQRATEFSWRRMAEETLKVYQEVVKGF